MAFDSTRKAGRRKALMPMLVSYAASGGSLIISSAAQLLTFAILARMLGVHEFSLFVAITAISNIAVHLCGLGAMESLVRRVARDRAMYPAMLGHNVILTGLSGTALVLLGTAVLPAFFKLVENPASNVAIIALMLVTNVVMVRLVVLAEQIFIAHSQFGPANIVVIGFALARTVAAVLACLVFSTNTVAGWAIWQFACHVLCAVACWFMIRPLGKARLGLVREEIPLGLYFSIPFILRAMRQNADLLVLSLVTAAEIVASYSVARRILDSSYLSVEALNRIVYPGSARAMAEGLGHAMPRVRKVLVAAVGLSFAAACSVYVLAPLLPWLFGAEYLSLVGFTRILCWIVIPMAIWAVALEALGASGLQVPRGLVLGLGSIIGAALAALGSWLAPPAGTFVAFYVIEIAMAVGAWSVLLHIARRDGKPREKP